MLPNYILGAALLASSALAVPATDASSTSSSSYTIIPIYPTSSTTSSLLTVTVTQTIPVGTEKSASTSATSTDSLSYSVVPIQGYPSATTITVIKSGSVEWTVTSTAPITTATGYPSSNTTTPAVVSSGAMVSPWASIGLAVAGTIVAALSY